MRRTTMDFSIVGQFFMAASAVSFSGTIFPRRIAAVGGDEDFGLAVGDTVGHGGGAEAAEDDGVHGADARAGEHGDG